MNTRQSGQLLDVLTRIAITLERNPMTPARIREEVLDEAARLATSYEPTCESCPRGVVDAIRALKGGEP